MSRTALTVLLAASLDLLVSAAHGYPLVRPLWIFPPPILDWLLVFAIEILFLLPIVLVSQAVLNLAQRLPALGPLLARAPRFAVLGPALLPVVLGRLYRPLATVDWPMVLALVMLALLVLAVELARRLPRPGRAEARWVALLCLLILLASPLLPSLRGSGVEAAEAPGSPGDGPSLLVLVLDTLRADHLGIYGYERDTSPWLDEFARGSTVFERAIAPSSYTLPSHATLFTGLYPETHGATIGDAGVSLSRLGLADDWAPVRPLSEDATTLAEITREAGFETGAVCANVAYLSPYFGLDQGFETYAVPAGGWYAWQPAGVVLGRKVFGKLLPESWDWWYQSRVLGTGRYYLFASEVNELASRWLESRRQRRFFLFLNYMDAHAPYLPLGDYRNLFPDSDSAQTIDRHAIESGARPIHPEERSALVDAYDAEIRYLDDRLADFFGQLEESGLLDDMIVVIVGDHGESFGEHGELEHATGLHEPQIHVPLMVRMPGQTEGRRESRPVHLADILPTLLDALGLATPGDLQAASLEQPERPLPIVAYLGPYGRDFSEHAIYSEPWKLIVSSLGDVELYDLANDPAETNNLAGEQPGVVRALIEGLEAFKQEARPRFQADGGAIDDATLEKLKALGYTD